MRKIFFCACACALFMGCGNEQPAAETETAVVASAAPQPAEIADQKYAEIGKGNLAAMSAGDVDTWMNSFADNARYFWNGGDSLVGKDAITAYWKKRRGEVIDSIRFDEQIWLPVKVNQPQQAIQAPGVWLLGWYRTTVKYKNGKTISQWMHVDYHFDASDKVDQVVHYVDRAPINAALGK